MEFNDREPGRPTILGSNTPGSNSLSPINTSLTTIQTTLTKTPPSPKSISNESFETPPSPTIMSQGNTETPPTTDSEWRLRQHQMQQVSEHKIEKRQNELQRHHNLNRSLPTLSPLPCHKLDNSTNALPFTPLSSLTLSSLQVMNNPVKHSATHYWNITSAKPLGFIKENIQLSTGKKRPLDNIFNNNLTKQSSLIHNLHNGSDSNKPSNTCGNKMTHRKNRYHPSSKKTQLYLDLGQRSFGKQTICSLCGMLIVHGLTEDYKEHAKVCKDYQTGVTCHGWKKERKVLTLANGDRILEVKGGGSADQQQQRDKVLQVKAIVDMEMGFVAAPVDSSLTGSSTSSLSLSVSNGKTASKKWRQSLDGMTAYLYISKRRVIGLLLVKHIHQAYELFSNEDTNPNRDPSLINSNSQQQQYSHQQPISRSLNPQKALLGIHQLWVHAAHRKHGIATHMMECARANLIFGMIIPLEYIAFSSPSCDGIQFAQRYLRREHPLVYDII